MHEVDVHLISDWADRVLEPGRADLGYLHLTDAQRAALGHGFAALRAAVLGEDPELPDPRPGGDALAVALQQYLCGMAAGIAATGADRDPTSLVAGLVAGAARLRFSWPAVDRFGAVQIAERGGLAAADVSGEGAGLAEILRAVVETMDALVCLTCEPADDHDGDVDLDGNPLDGRTGDPVDPSRPRPASPVDHPDDSHLAVVVVAVIEQLYHVVAAVTDPGLARRERPPSRCAPRRFLAEISCTIDAPPAVHHALQRTLDSMGTDLRVAPTATEDVFAYHLHTGFPGAVVAEIYALATPFALEISSLEPPPGEPW